MENAAYIGGAFRFGQTVQKFGNGSRQDTGNDLLPSRRKKGQAVFVISISNFIFSFHVGGGNRFGGGGRGILAAA